MSDFVSDIEKRFGLSIEQLLALMFVTVVVFGALAVAGLLMVRASSSQPPAESPIQPSYDIPTAREAYVPAVVVARQWDLGAELASAAGAWTPVIDPLQLSSGRTGWTFHFYFPGRGEMATVIVDQVENAWLSDVQPWETPPRLRADEDWQIDSPEAARLLLEQCQAALDAHPDAQVEIRLSTAAANRRLLWQGQVILPDELETACEVSIDATTGQVR